MANDCLSPRQDLVKRWYKTLKESGVMVKGVAVAPVQSQCFLKSRRFVPNHQRQRGPEAGRSFEEPIIRQELYGWWSSMRFAIDWRPLKAQNRDGGRKMFGPVSESGAFAKSTTTDRRACGSLSPEWKTLIHLSQILGGSGVGRQSTGST